MMSPVAGPQTAKVSAPSDVESGLLVVWVVH
jgi:hypothetical protein